MADQGPPRSTPGTPKTGRTSTTRKETEGEVLPVTNPMDLWYLCQKASYAEQFPLRNSKGHPMYQRTVTQWVRKDGQFFQWHFPYYGEVGFDMTQSPPQAIMSLNEADRPSTMPLSRYESIISRYLLNSTGIGIDEPLLTKDFLEDNLSPEDFRRAGKMVEVAGENLFGILRPARQRVEGLLRIPDIVRVTDWSIKGADRYKPENLAFVIEMKFGEDKMKWGQITDYRKIAGNDPDKLRLLETRVCKVERGRRREWLEAARRTEPVFRNVRVGGPPSRTARAIALEEAIGEYSLLMDDIEAEHRKVRRLLQPEPIPADTPQMRAWDPERERQAEQQRQRARASMELALGAPLAAAAVGTLVIGGGTLLGGGAVLGEGATVTATQTGKLIQFPLGRVVAGAAANAAAYQAAAAPADQPAASVPVYDPYAPRWLVYIDE